MAVLPRDNNEWSFSPSLGASILFLVLLFLCTSVHFAQAIYHRKPYCIVIILSGLVQTLTYIFRTVSIKTPDSFADYAAWFILILIAPLFTNAFVYMVFGRMVWNYTPDHQVWRIKAWNFTTIFVILDIVAFIIQVYGAATAATTKVRDTLYTGLHVYMGGVGLQQLFILVFCLYAAKLFTIMRNDKTERRNPNAMPLLVTLFVVLALITLRICFRLAEYSQGLNSTIPDHEAYQYCLDSLPMLTALVLLNIFHPGRIITGDGSNMPSRRERRRLAGKEQRSSDGTPKETPYQSTMEA